MPSDHPPGCKCFVCVVPIEAPGILSGNELSGGVVMLPRAADSPSFNRVSLPLDIAFGKGPPPRRQYISSWDAEMEENGLVKKQPFTHDDNCLCLRCLNNNPDRLTVRATDLPSDNNAVEADAAIRPKEDNPYDIEEFQAAAIPEPPEEIEPSEKWRDRWLSPSAQNEGRMRLPKALRPLLDDGRSALVNVSSSYVAVGLRHARLGVILQIRYDERSFIVEEHETTYGNIPGFKKIFSSRNAMEAVEAYVCEVDRLLSIRRRRVRDTMQVEDEARVTVYDDGSASCTCEAWCFAARRENRVCKHVVPYLSEVGRLGTFEIPDEGGPVRLMRLED
jgi:hypothetical protein